MVDAVVDNVVDVKFVAIQIVADPEEKTTKLRQIVPPHDKDWEPKTKPVTTMEFQVLSVVLEDRYPPALAPGTSRT